MIYNCSKEMMKFLSEKVRLSDSDQSKLREYRKTNLDRLKKGLEKNDSPMHIRYINQGSYAMNTINQHPDNDYDIDIGIIFHKDDLLGKQNADKTALESRKMVCQAMQDNRFSKSPEVLKNCVRVYYNEGYHIDMPIYRTYEKDGKTVQELASSDWKESDPEGITNWFNSAVIEKSPDEDNGRQMRRITRLGKKFLCSRKSWNMPSGFIFSVLIDELYVPKERDDESLYQTLKAMCDRLYKNKSISNPINGSLISEGKEAQLTKLYCELKFHLENTLFVLEDESCSQEQALKAWSRFFKDDFFETKIEKAHENNTSSLEQFIGIAGVAVAAGAAAVILANNKDDDYEIKKPEKPWISN